MVCEMQHENIQKVLLTNAKLDLEKAMEISLGMEATTKKAKEFKVPSIHNQSWQSRLQVQAPQQALPTAVHAVDVGITTKVIVMLNVTSVARWVT